jgi:hypothetical protein
LTLGLHLQKSVEFEPGRCTTEHVEVSTECRACDNNECPIEIYEQCDGSNSTDNGSNNSTEDGSNCTENSFDCGKKVEQVENQSWCRLL